jgi:putative sigma-54 modulation protein
MQIKVSTRHGHIDDEIQGRIKEKAERLTHLFDRLTMIEVTVDHQRSDSLVEFLVQAEHKHDFVAREKHTELMAAVDLALDKISMQLRRYKEKIQDHRRDVPMGELGRGNGDSKGSK